LISHQYICLLCNSIKFLLNDFSTTIVNKFKRIN
jgi:hypothetical protein